jgi:hypothetical protein
MNMTAPLSSQSSQALPSLTVGEVLDERIADARKKLEAACVKKAKAEALQILDWPFDDLSRLLDLYPF